MHARAVSVESGAEVVPIRRVRLEPQSGSRAAGGVIPAVALARDARRLKEAYVLSGSFTRALQVNGSWLRQIELSIHCN